MLPIAKQFFESSFYQTYLSFLSNHYFEFMTFHWIAIIVLFLMNLKNIKKILSKIDRKTWICLFLIFVFALSLRTAKYTNTFYDEGNPEYKLTAKNLKEKWSTCEYGSGEKCLSESVPWHPGGWTYILSLTFLAFGATTKIAMFTTILLGSLTVFSIFLLSYILFKNQNLSLISSFILAILPAHIKFSVFTSASGPSIFFSSLAIFFIIASIKIDKPKMYLFALSFLYFAMQIRPESAELLGLLTISSFILFKKIDKNFLKKIKKPFLISLLFIFPLLDWRIFTGLGYGNVWTSYGELGGLTYIKKGLPELISFLTDINLNSILSGLFLYSIYLGLKKKSKEIKFLGFWFLAFSFIYLVYSNFTGLSLRYLINLYTPFVILSAFAIDFICSYSNNYKKLLILVLIIIVLIFPVGNFPIFKRDGGFKEKKILEIEKDVPDKDFLITEIPELIFFENPSQRATKIEPIGNFNIEEIPKWLENNITPYYIKYHSNVYGNRSCHPFMYKGKLTDFCELAEKNYTTKFVKNYELLDLYKIIS